MVPVSTTIACCVTLFISLILPVILLIAYAAKNKKSGIVSAWLIGAAGFFVTQICIRIPILMALQSQSWFLSFAENHLFLYALTLGFTAGLFELAGRYAAAKLMRKNLTYKRSLAAGLGHGGIEAMILIGTTYIHNLVYILMINSGTFDTVVAQTAALGVDVSQLELIKQQLLTISPAMFLLAGFERILTMIAHTAMSMLVCHGVARKRTGLCVLVCLGIHTFIDTTAGISLLAGSALSQTAAYTLIYTILTAVAVVSVLVIRDLRRRWQAEPQKEVSL